MFLSESMLKMDQSERAHVISYLDSMDDHILIKILGYLPVAELFKLEIVCKRWAEVVSWMWKRFTGLEWYRNTGVCLEERSRNILCLYSGPNHLFSLARLCGANIAQLKLVAPPEEVSLVPLFERCIALTHLRLETGRLDHESLAALAKSAGNLHSLTLSFVPLKFCKVVLGKKSEPRPKTRRCAPFSCDLADQLHVFLQSLSRLEHLEWSLYQEKVVYATYILPSLPPSLQSLILQSAEVKQSDLVAFLRSHRNLIKLDLGNGLLAAGEGGMTALLHCIPSDIQELAFRKIEYCYMMQDCPVALGPAMTDMSHLGQLAALRELTLVEIPIFTNAALEVVCKGCRNLEVLRLSDYSAVDGSGLEFLGKLQRLRILDISGVRNAVGSDLIRGTTGLSCLVELSLTGDRVSSPGDWVALARNCPNLEWLKPHDYQQDGWYWFLDTLLRARADSVVPCKLQTRRGEAQFTPEEWIKGLPSPQEMKLDQLPDKLRKLFITPI